MLEMWDFCSKTRSVTHLLTFPKSTCFAVGTKSKKMEKKMLGRIIENKTPIIATENIIFFFKIQYTISKCSISKLFGNFLQPVMENIPVMVQAKSSNENSPTQI